METMTENALDQTEVARDGARALLRRDAAANAHNTKGLLIVLFYRITHILYCASRRHGIVRLLYMPVAILYKVVVDYILCCHIPPATRIGGGLRVFHGYGITIGAEAVLGDNVTLRHNVTIGNKREGDPRCPRIGNNVTFGTGATVVGDIAIGDGATIGAGAIVVSSVPAGAVAVGPAAKLL